MNAERRASETSDEPRFVWPPRSSECTPAPASITDSSSDVSWFASLIDSIEIDLLGRTTLAFDRWAARTGWAPEDRSQSCWRCAGSVGPHEQDGEGCAACRSKKLPWDRAMRLGVYDDELRDEVLSLKFRSWRPGGDGLGRHLGRLVLDQLQRAQIDPASVCLVPIPTNRWRRIARGIDHTLVLARAASRETGCPVASVISSRYRPEQVGLSATARAKNIKDAFVVRPKALKKRMGTGGRGVRVWVLIDDVRTTGATFTAASRALRGGLRACLGPGESPGEIWVCSVAVAGERNRRKQAESAPEIVVRGGAGASLIGPEQMVGVGGRET